MSEVEKLRVVIFRDGDGWAAQCLEHDICAYADDLGELQRRFEATFALECQISQEIHGEPLKGISPAPENFQRMWDECPGKYEPGIENKLSQRNIDFAMCA